MIHVDVQQAQADLARYLERVARGETVVVCKDNEPIAEIRPVAVPARRTGPRPLGLGQVPPACFDPLPPDLSE